MGVRGSGGEASPDRVIDGCGIGLTAPGAGMELAEDLVRQGAELRLDQRRVTSGFRRSEKGSGDFGAAVMDQPGQTPGTCRVIAVKQRVLGKQFATQLQQIVKAQLLEAARVGGRDRRGLVQIEDNVVEKKQHKHTHHHAGVMAAPL